MKKIILIAGEYYEILEELQNGGCNISELVRRLEKKKQRCSRPIIGEGVKALESVGLIKTISVGRSKHCELTDMGRFILKLNLQGVKNVREAIEKMPNYRSLGREDLLEKVAMKLGLSPDKIKDDFYATLKVMDFEPDKEDTTFLNMVMEDEITRKKYDKKSKKEKEES